MQANTQPHEIIKLGIVARAAFDRLVALRQRHAAEIAAGERELDEARDQMNSAWRRWREDRAQHRQPEAA